MSRVKLDAKLPKDEADQNGLDHIADLLVKKPSEVRLVVAMVTVPKILKEISHSAESGDIVTEIPHVQIHHIEPLTNPRDAALAQKLLDRALAMRSGRDPLPLDFSGEQTRLDGNDEPDLADL